MSEKDYAKSLLDTIPATMLGRVIAYMQGMIASESADDAFCEALYENYQKDTDKNQYVTLEEMAEKSGVNLNEI